MPVIDIKAISSLEKCFLDEHLEDKEEITSFTVFANQPLCYQIALTLSESRLFKNRYNVRLTGDLAPYATMRRVVNMPNHFPCRETVEQDRNYLRFTPGLYPDLLRPLHYHNMISLTNNELHAVWISADLPEGFAAGNYSLTFELTDAKTAELLASKTVRVRVLATELPPQRLIHTEWFYTDCIANHYHARAFSERHWKLIESFLRTAARNGINMILTPIFTPELDTYIGGERLTTQLLGIEVVGKNKYAFDFAQVDRWIDLCHSLGIRYFEFAHFFTQWGANHAPKIIATVNGKKKRIFGWETDACGEEYPSFLAQMITALTDYLEQKGVLRNCYFHVSDEPKLTDLDQYLRCKNMIEPYLKGAPIIDALSDYAFYETGVLKKPVPGIKHIAPFLENKVEGLWAYYCGDSGVNVSGRMFAMSLGRTRILGVQLWLHNIEGFLHWGYNFYNNQNSYDVLDPFLYTDGEYFVPAGDTFLVYPGDDETAWESMRLNALREATEDMRLLDLCASRLGREATESLVLEAAGGTLTFTEYPRETNFLFRLREKLIAAIGE